MALELMDYSPFAPNMVMFKKFGLNVQATALTIKWDAITRLINLDELKTRADFRPPIVYALRANNADGTWTPAELTNYLGLTLGTKENIQDYSIRSQFWPSLIISIPCIDATFNECYYRLLYNKRGLVVPIETNVVPVVDRVFQPPVNHYDASSRSLAVSTFDTRLEQLPTLEITGPDSVMASDSAVYTVSAKMNGAPYLRPIHVDIDTSHGVNSDWRIVLTGSIAFTFDALNVPAGVTASIKAGFRFWPSLVDKKITITGRS